jgi:hypothetical protein
MTHKAASQRERAERLVHEFEALAVERVLGVDDRLRVRFGLLTAAREVLADIDRDSDQ